MAIRAPDGANNIVTPEQFLPRVKCRIVYYVSTMYCSWQYVGRGEGLEVQFSCNMQNASTSTPRGQVRVWQSHLYREQRVDPCQQGASSLSMYKTLTSSSPAHHQSSFLSFHVQFPYFSPHQFLISSSLVPALSLSSNVQEKHRKNCKCCLGHCLIVNHYY